MNSMISIGGRTLFKIGDSKAQQTEEFHILAVLMQNGLRNCLLYTAVLF